MYYELPDGYPMIEDTPISNWCVFSHLRNNRMDEDTDDFDLSGLFGEDVFTMTSREVDNSDVNKEIPTLAITRNTTAEKDVTPQPNELESITNDAGTADEQNNSGLDSKNNKVGNYNINNSNDMMVLHKAKGIVKRTRNFDNEENDNTEDCLNVNDPPVKRKTHSYSKRKQRKAERKNIRRPTVRKLKNIRYAESSLWKYLLTSNILLRLYKIKHYKSFQIP